MKRKLVVFTLLVQGLVVGGARPTYDPPRHAPAPSVLESVETVLRPGQTLEDRLEEKPHRAIYAGEASKPLQILLREAAAGEKTASPR